MISLAGTPVRSCEGLSRREWLRAGALGSLGLSLPGFLAARARAARRDGAAPPQDLRAGRARGFGRARAGIVLFLFGGPAHQDVWDLKPEAPAEVRGEPIAALL